MCLPLVSVITPVFNNVRYIEECILSVLEQNYPNIEHVFVDGGSTDGTLDILKRFNERYPERVRYISEPDRGACDAWNKGWGMAKGEILGWLGADDLYEHNAISDVVDFFGANPEALFVSGGCNIIDKNSQLIVKVPASEFNLEKALSGHNCIMAPAAFYKREVIEKVGSLDISINICDHDYWIRVGKLFPIYRTENCLASFRIHDKSVSGVRGSFRLYLKEHYYIQKKHRSPMLLCILVRWPLFGIIELIRMVLGPRQSEFYYRYISPALVRFRKIKVGRQK